MKTFNNSKKQDSNIRKSVSKLLIMSNNFLSVDWRDAPPPKEVIHRLEQVFTDLDDTTKSGTTLRLSQSTAKNAYAFVKNNGHPIVMRRNNSV